jgi:hypothetical protein
MENYIINSFIIKYKNTLDDIYNYINYRYDSTIEINEIKKILTKLVKKNILLINNNFYQLAEEGNIILNDQKYYYSRIIYNFYKKYSKNSKKYELKEIRKEQQKLRDYLISNKQQICIICDKNLPLCLLETAHLKPRYILNKNEINDINIVEFMCRYCHNLYDNGFLSIYDGILQISEFIYKYNLHYDKNKKIIYFNSLNEKYFTFHYKYIFKN